MRLWHTDLISVLPRQQMLGQWRELNSIYKNQNKHILINFVYDKPKVDLSNYSARVMREMENRCYNIDHTNFHRYFKPEDIVYMQKPFSEKMDDKYLTECYFNLMEKHDCGGITDEEWQKIDKVARKRVYEWVMNNMGEEK